MPVESDTCGFAGKLIGFQKSGDVFGDAIEDGFGRFLFFGSAGFGAFFLFYDFPVAENVGSRLCTGGAENVRVTANHFVVDGTNDVGDVKTIFFVSDLRVEENLKQKIAEFFREFCVVRGVEGVEDFVGFFNEIRAKGGVGLFAVPRAAFRGAETGHYGDEFFEGRTGAGRGETIARRFFARASFTFCDFFWHGEIIQGGGAAGLISGGRALGAAKESLHNP